MAVLAYHYRATIYASDDTTPLTPIGGAAHSDNFTITSQSGVAGWKSYVCGDFPTGRRGTIDRLTGKYSIGEITLRVLDAKVATNNLQRWVTAFFGDANGRTQFIGHKMKIEEYNGSAWSDYFTGRIASVLAPDPGIDGPYIDFVIREETLHAKRNVFVGAPHPAVASYAKPAQLLPIGSGYLDTPITGKIVTTSTGDLGIQITDSSATSYWLKQRTRLTKALATRADFQSVYNNTSQFYCPYVRIKVTKTADSTSGDFYLATCGTASSVPGVPYDDGNGLHSPIWLDKKQKGHVVMIGIAPIPNDPANTAHPYKYKALADIPAGTAVTFHAYNAGPPTPDAGILISDVHPVTLWKDLNDGYFSNLNDQGSGLSGETVDGSVAVRTIPYDATTFAALAGDGTIGTLRFIITNQWKLEEFLSQQLFQVRHIGGCVKGDGKVYAKDLRLTAASSSGAATIGADDIIDAHWEQGQDSVGLIGVQLYTETPVGDLEITGNEDPILDIETHGIRQRVETIAFATLRANDFSARTLTIDAQGLKADLPSVFYTAYPWALREVARPVAVPYDQVFGTSAAYLAGSFRRTANTDKWPGDYVIIDVDEMPDAASNLRGGARLMMVLERSDEGVARKMRFVDAGPDSVAVAPSVATPTVDGTIPKHCINCTVTLNASSEPVVVQVASTATSEGSPPAADSALWITRAKIDATTAVKIDQLPSGKRHWVRAQSVPIGKMPSSWAQASGTKYADTTALTAPNTVATSVSGRSVVVTWVNGETAYDIMPTIDGAAARDKPLPAGTKRYVHDELAASTAFTFGVKHVDPYGGESSIATAAGTTSTAATLNAPRSIQILQGRGATSRVSIPPEAVTVGFGFQVRIKPTEPAAYLRVQVSTDSGFSPVDQSIELDPGVTTCFITVPDDGVLRYIRAYHTRAGFTTSAAAGTVSAYPVALVAQAESDAFAGGTAYLSYESDGTLKLNVDTGGDSDTDRFYYDTARNSATYPTVTTSSSYILRSAMPYFATITIGASDHIGGDEVKLAGYFWNAVTGFGQYVSHSIAAPSSTVRKPSVRITSVTQSGSTGTFQLAVDDPDLTCTVLGWRQRDGNAAYGGLSYAWDSSTGTIGANTTLVRTQSITISSAKHTSTFQAWMSYSLDGVTAQQETFEHTFDIDTIANVTGASITFDGSGTVIVTAVGDEDTANMYVTITTNGSAPSDPTSGSNNGTISGRSGSVTSAITASDGDTVKVKVRGYNSVPSAGTVFGPISAIYTAGSVTPTVEVINAYITANVNTTPTPDECTPTVTYTVSMPGGYTFDLDYVTTDSQSVETTKSIATGETTTTRSAYTGFGNCGYYYNKPTYTDWVNVQLRLTIKNGGGSVVLVRYSNSITYNYVLAI